MAVLASEAGRHGMRELARFLGRELAAEQQKAA